MNWPSDSSNELPYLYMSSPSPAANRSAETSHLRTSSVPYVFHASTILSVKPGAGGHVTGRECILSMIMRGGAGGGGGLGHQRRVRFVPGGARASPNAWHRAR